jgi:nitrogen fixation protein FixH
MNTSAWRWFPHSLIATMLAVFLVNAYMVYDAYSTFPGSAGRDGFDLSNEYKRVLATAQEQAALGWHVETEAGADGFPVLRLTGADDKAIVADEVAAQAERPVGPVSMTPLSFHRAGDGLYQADVQLAPGQWDIMLEVRARGHQFKATRRVAVK